VLVVDDEPLAREHLIQTLNEAGGTTVVGTCSSGAEALVATREVRPDVVFLDIRMPGGDGLDVAARLEAEGAPYVVFVTAYDRYAIEAFRLRALDYVLKPVQPARLADALDRARKQLRADVALRTAGASPEYLTELVVRVGSHETVVRVPDVEWIEADTCYARLHVGGRAYLLRERMHVLEARLDPRRFARVHRSAIVNLSRVTGIRHSRRGEHFIELAGGQRVRASRSRWPRFRRLMRERAGRQ
jgi:two-component system LytT family response regulator